MNFDELNAADEPNATNEPNAAKGPSDEDELSELSVEPSDLGAEDEYRMSVEK